MSLFREMVGDVRAREKRRREAIKEKRLRKLERRLAEKQGRRVGEWKKRGGFERREISRGVIMESKPYRRGEPIKKLKRRQ